MLFVTSNSVQMSIIVFLASVPMIFLTIGRVDGQVVGRVTINETNSFSFNENSATGTIPILMQLFNQTEIIRDYDGNVNLTCELVSIESGFSQATFSAEEIFNPAGSDYETIATDIPFTIVMPGREIGVQCWGVSFDMVGDQQFTKETSLSPSVPFMVRKRGTVNICSEVVLVPLHAESEGTQASGTFYIELSEAVIESNVTVTCESTPINAESPSLELTFPNITMTPGQKKLMVEYEIIRQGSPVSVRCRGQSVDQGTFGQFVEENSIGDPVIFTTAEAGVRLLPELTVLRSTYMKVFLVLEDPTNSEVTFTCRAQVVNTTEEAQELAENPFCSTVTSSRIPPRPVLNDTSPVTTSAPISPDITDVNATLGEWEIQEGNVVFEEDDIYKVLELRRMSVPDKTIQELVVVSCCAPDADYNNNPVYTNKSAVMMVVAQTQPAVAINWTAADSVDAILSESVIINPAYVEVAPCPCDLTENYCNQNCCCDQSCTDDEKATFTCIGGTAGGLPPEDPRYLCTSQYANKPDWFPMTCVHQENSAFLGYFYYPQSGLSALPDYSLAAQPVRPDYTYRETEDQSPEEDLPGIGYQQGVSVKTGLPRTTPNDYYVGPNYRLTLPRRSLNGECIKTAPVQYLTDSSDECVYTISPELCTADSMLSARMYVQATTKTHPPCPGSPMVLQENGAKIVSTTYTDYLCTGDISDYIYSLQPSEDVFSATKRYKFAHEIPEGEGSSCYFDELTGAYVCNTTAVPGSGVPPSVEPPRCSWDDSFTEPPTPVYDEATQICQNAVLDVYYNFTWKGDEILELNATFIIGDLPMKTEYLSNRSVEYINGSSDIVMNVTEEVVTMDTVLSQIFNVQFFPLYIAPNLTEIENTTAMTGERYERSGNPGYEIGRDLISGIAVFNDSTLDFRYIDINDTSRLSVWSAGSDGLCQNSGRQITTFGEDTSGSCLLRLSQSDLQNCQNLRQLVLNQQDLLMPSSYLSLGGDPDRFTLTTEWIDILRESLAWLMPNYTEPVMTTETMMTSEVMTTEITTTESADDSTGNITDDLGDESFTQAPPVTYADYVSQLTGRCPHIPAGIHVDILYAIAGRSNWKPIYNVVGAKISYSLRMWQMSCGGSDGVRCHNESVEAEELVQSFMLSSSVTYTLVPASPPPPSTKYELKHLEEELVCKQEACWRELFYPFLSHNASDPPMYTIAFGLTAVFFIIGLFIMTKPWW